jgi:hypothetical protein
MHMEDSMLYEKNIQIVFVPQFFSFSFLWTLLVEDISTKTTIEKEKEQRFYLLWENLFSLKNIDNVV